MLSSDAPLVLLQHGGLDNLSGKTGLAMLRYRQGPIVAVIDPAHAGGDLRTITGIDRAVPVVADLESALALGPAVAVVGLAPSGGRLPLEMRADVVAALRAGLSLASGLHSRLAADPEFAAIPLAPDQWIWDLRQEPPELEVAAARCAALPCRRLLAVGSDMAVGKMSACLELQRAAQRSGVDARFVGTGQAGILISGQGVALDAVRVDYAAGAVEAAVLAAALRCLNLCCVLFAVNYCLCRRAGCVWCTFAAVASFSTAIAVLLNGLCAGSPQRPGPDPQSGGAPTGGAAHTAPSGTGAAGHLPASFRPGVRHPPGLGGPMRAGSAGRVALWRRPQTALQRRRAGAPHLFLD